MNRLVKSAGVGLTGGIAGGEDEPSEARNTEYLRESVNAKGMRPANVSYPFCFLFLLKHTR